ncbi:MAG: PIN domain-containing protein [Microcystis sp. M53603_WE2]|uniref:type II toxin-antitoxin system VapC family toxin n=1 Tax=Microcystis sp. M53603_WE2 TaxID=3030678 RepID=UPI00258E9E7B|nr:PIN domain-containing protein [Microcystis sp. M53603_WE2]MDJ0540525.1 PIN domain-containing protein [Microcystis sp. M53603_WE2]
MPPYRTIPTNEEPQGVKRLTTYQDVRRQVENLTPDEQLRLLKELAVTSTLTLSEVLVHPLRSGNVELAGQYRDILLDQENLITVPISLEIAEVAAQLRARQNLRTPDAIQIATAMGEGAMFFLTNDARLAAVPDLKVLVLDAL